jgi:hypothetical protein
MKLQIATKYLILLFVHFEANAELTSGRRFTDRLVEK